MPKKERACGLEKYARLRWRYSAQSQKERLAELDR
jgi:hypothetical protein